MRLEFSYDGDGYNLYIYTSVSFLYNIRSWEVNIQDGGNKFEPPRAGIEPLPINDLLPLDPNYLFEVKHITKQTKKDEVKGEPSTQILSSISNLTRLIQI